MTFDDLAFPLRAGRLRKLMWLLVASMVAGMTVTGVVIASGATMASASASASAASSLKPGAGKWTPHHADFVGYYRARVAGSWVKVYCVSPGKQTPSRITLSTVSRLTSVSVAVTRQLAETLAAHGNAASAAQAEAVSQALNYELGNRAAVERRARYLSKAVQARAMSYVAEARRLRGAFVLHLNTPARPLPGQTGTATISLRGAGGGKPAVVRLTHSANVATPRLVRTSAAGRGTFSYRTTGGGEVHITASVAGLAPTTLRVSHPSSATQRMLTWSPTVGARASASYRGTVVGFTHRYECSSTCNGHPVANLTACAPASSYPSRLTYRYAGQAHRLDFPAATTRRCRSWTTTLADGERVTAAWQYRTAQGWTGLMVAAGSFVVDCPAAPAVAVVVSYDCRAATVIVALGRAAGAGLVPTRNRTAHRMVLVLSGARSGRYSLEPGATATPHAFPITCGTHATVAVRGGVQRHNGAYNYGPPAQVVLP
jgi:hypothetical protein